MATPLLPNLENVTTNNLLNKRRESKGDICCHCGDSFAVGESKILFNNGQFHKRCFVCAQCLNELEIDVVFQNENRIYCLHDYKMQFAPSCNQCNEFIFEGRVIKALGHNWHASCFICTMCKVQLSDHNTFKKINNNPYCKVCCEKIKGESTGTLFCYQCKSAIELNGYLKCGDHFYHPYHFKCKICQRELDKNFKERNGEHFCLHCYDRMGIPICSACKRPVEERVVYALGNVYHVEHFTCNFCNKPFLGSHYFVHKKEVYCESHYRMMVVKMCTYCNKDVGSSSVEFQKKFYCADHFTCFACDCVLYINAALYKVDGKPLCKQCRKRLPSHLLRRLAQLHSKDL